MAKQKNYKISIEINVKDESSLELSIDEVVRLIKEGFTYGMNNNDDDDFKFHIGIDQFPTYRQKLQEMTNEATNMISKKIHKIGIKSKYSSNYVIRLIPEYLQFDLTDERYLIEIGQPSTGLIDSHGYQYDYSILNHEQLMQIADYIQNRKR